MKSLILTSLYLFKDTLYRWKERPSSPLSRLLVVFFLSLCALSFLANYVLSTKAIQNEIRRNGGDLIIVTDLEREDTISKMKLIIEDVPKLCDVEMVILNDLGAQGLIDSVKVPIAEYNDESMAALSEFPLEQFPYLALLPQDSVIPEGPSRLDIMGYVYDLVVRKIPDDHMLQKAFGQGVVLVPEGVSASIPRHGTSRRYLIRVKEMTHENVRKIDYSLKNISRMDGSFCSVFSSEPLLAQLSIMMSNQNECRAGFSIGIAVIVGILLTALASMEFRENEYVYTLMKSFGVRPFYLVATFIFENIFLVGTAFVASIAFFLESQKIIMTEFFKLKDVLTLQDLWDDIFLLAASLLICVIVSSIPIVASAYREIGRVLK